MIYQKSEIIVLLGLLVIFVQGWPQEVPPRGNIVRKTHILQDSINGARAKGANPINDASHYNILGVANGQNTTTTEPPKIEKKNRNVKAILKKKAKNVQKSDERKKSIKNKLRSLRNNVEIEHINPTYVNATSTTSRPVIVTQNLNYTTSASSTVRPIESDISSTAIITTPIPTELSKNSSDPQSTTPIPSELKGNTSDPPVDKASTTRPITGETPVGNTPNVTQAVPDSKNATASGAPAAGALANATRSGPDGTPGAGTNDNSTAGSSPTGIQNGASGANSTSGSPGSSASSGSSASTASPGSSSSGILSLEH